MGNDEKLIKLLKCCIAIMGTDCARLKVCASNDTRFALFQELLPELIEVVKELKEKGCI